MCRFIVVCRSTGTSRTYLKWNDERHIEYRGGLMSDNDKVLSIRRVVERNSKVEVKLVGGMSKYNNQCYAT